MNKKKQRIYNLAMGRCEGTINLLVKQQFKEFVLLCYLVEIWKVLIELINAYFSIYLFD